MDKPPTYRRTRSRSLSGPTSNATKSFSPGSSKDRLDKFDIAASQTGFPELSNNLVAIAAQLTAYNQELQQRTKERDELQKLLKRLKTEVTNAKSLVQKLEWSCDKSSNEVIQYKTKVTTLHEENAVFPQEFKKLQREIDEVCNIYCVSYVVDL
jgi:chromosome segregation ATPase